MKTEFNRFAQGLNRRTFLSRGAYGLGGLALASLLNPLKAAAAAAGSEKWRGVVNPTHFPARARRVIHLCMAGGPSHLESLDYKPALKKINGQPFPDSFTKGQQLAQLQGATLKAMAPACEFKKWGQSGQEISALFPSIGGIADELCIVRSMHTEQINHDPAHAFMNAGTSIKGRPSMGSWLLYGLGAETESLPGFVVLTSKGGGGGVQPVSARQWSSGFLPSEFQGVQFQSTGAPVHYVGNPEGVCQSAQRQVIEEVNRLNGFLAQDHFDPEIQTRISQYELAFRMQVSVPELADFSQEPKSMLDFYGVQHPGDGSFASNCLLARRLAERGVRFIQLYHRSWDHHGDIANQMAISAREVDQASAALIKDLKQRGMLEDTLVIWGGEFGRTPMGQGSGRDHHINAFSLWMAGGGIKPGMSWGQTDELGYKYIEDGQQMHVHDLHATMLRLCGIDHKRLTYRCQGRDFRLTDVSGEVAQGIIA
ncbi:MAG TPA: DUF1501 domain-containing protein [Verrucomicrobiae bacterium]|jgi:hypothetical protein